MPSHNQYPVAETEPPINQRFEGQIIDEFVQEGHTTRHIPILRAEISKDDSLVIAPDAESPTFPDFMSAPVVAQLKLGGQGGNSRAQEALIVRVDPDNQDDRLRSYVGDAERNSDFDKTKPFFLAVIADQSTISGFTPIWPSTGFGLFGRFQNNMDWYDAYGKPYSDNPNEEVIHNKSVSRQQLVFSFDRSGGLRISGSSEISDTVVVTVATKEHRKIIEQNEAAKKDDTTQPDKGSRASKRIIGRLLRNR